MDDFLLERHFLTRLQKDSGSDCRIFFNTLSCEMPESLENESTSAGKNIFHDAKSSPYVLIFCSSQLMKYIYWREGMHLKTEENI